jgi:hypothetical protein
VSFLEPLYLAGLLAAALPVVVHLINRRKAVNQPFPAIQLLRESDKKEAQRLKVRRWLLMALRILAIALLAFALAKPYCLSEQGVASDSRLPQSVVFVVDDSMSMHREGWFEEATNQVHDRLGELKPWDEVALIAASELDEPVGQLHTDKNRVREALGELSPSHRTVNLPQALTAAGDILSTSELPNRRVVLVSDFTRGGFPDSSGPDESLGYEVERVSVRDEEAVQNLAITGVGYQQVGPAREGEWEISTTIENFGTEKIEDVELRLEIGDEAVGGGLIDVAAGEKTTHTIRHTEKGTGVRRGTVRLIDADGMEVDNRRHFTFRMQESVDVLLVNGAPSSVAYNDELYFTTRALNPGQGSDSEIVPTVVTREGFGDEKLANYDVVLLANVTRVNDKQAEALQTFVDNGGGLFVAVGDQVDPEMYNESLGKLLPKPLRHGKRLARKDDPDAPVKITRLGASEREHPVFRVFDLPGGASLQQVRVYKYMLLEPSPPEQSRVVLSYKDGAPALIERKVGNGRVFLWTSTLDRGWTDFPTRTAFLPLMRRSMLYLARRATSEGDRARKVGERVELDVGGLIDDRAVVRGPGDRRWVLEPEEGRVSFVPPADGGYTVWNGAEGDDEGRRIDALAFSVNVSNEESDLGALEEGALEPWIGDGGEGGEGGSDQKVQKKRVNIWPTLLFAVTLALLLETLIGTRRSVLKKVWRRMTLQSDPEIDV